MEMENKVSDVKSYHFPSSVSPRRRCKVQLFQTFLQYRVVKKSYRDKKDDLKKKWRKNLRTYFKYYKNINMLKNDTQDHLQDNLRFSI